MKSEELEKILAQFLDKLPDAIATGILKADDIKRQREEERVNALNDARTKIFEEAERKQAELLAKKREEQAEYDRKIEAEKEAVINARQQAIRQMCERSAVPKSLTGVV